jgi:hypothetical protein
MDKLLIQIANYYNQLCSCDSTAGRAYNGKAIIAIFETHPEVCEHWMYRPEEFLWQDRFIRVSDYHPTPDVPVFRDDRTNLRLAPHATGLYFFGNTAYNPETGEVQYWVKIGVGVDLWERARAYRTCNPSAYVIGYKETCQRYREENEYHKRLEQLALYRNQNNDEWWMVDRETYLTMCEKSFDFFGKIY